MSLAFLNIIIYIIISFLLANIIHELFHFFALKLIGLDLYCLDAYPIKIYKNEGKYNIKIDINLKEYMPGFVLPEVSMVRNETDFNIKKNKIIFVALAGSVGSLVLGSVVILIQNYYIPNLFIEVFAIMSIIIGILTLLFSDGIMAYRMYNGKVFAVSTLLYFNNILSNQKQDINEQNLFIYKYANDVCEELNMEDKFFYNISHNKNQINLQTYILYFALINNFNDFSINIIKNMDKFIENLPKIKYLNGNLFEYINVIIIHMVIEENKLEEAKKIFELIRISSTKRSFYQKYIINRTKYFLGEISYSDALRSMPKTFLVNHRVERVLFEQFINSKKRRDKYYLENFKKRK